MLREGLSLAEMGRRLGCHESTVAGRLWVHGLRPLNADKHAARGGLDRAELERLVARGLSIAQIAAAVDRSKATVRHWLVCYGLKTVSQSGGGPRAETRAARERKLQRTKLICHRHGLTDFVLEGRGYHRCASCRAERVSRRRRKVKETLVAEAGGSCVLCGYSRCIAALQFHHLDPETKRFHLSRHGVARSIAKARAEAAKCLLVCANCHAEIEHGLAAARADVANDGGMA